MKRLIAISFAIVMAVAAFAGCNGGEKAGSAVSQAASNVVSGAGSVVDDAGNGLKKAGSAVDDNAEKLLCCKTVPKEFHSTVIIIYLIGFIHCPVYI